MASPLHLAQSRTFPFPTERAFPFTISVPLERLFDRRYGPLPPITHTVQDGAWSTAGQTREVHTSDGGSLREHLLTVDEPRSFTYELTDVKGPMKPLARSIDGAWIFEPVGTGCRITWTWVIHPTTSTAAVALPALGRMWRGYARRALDRLDELLIEHDAITSAAVPSAP